MILPIVMTLLSGVRASARTYATSFSLTENPISEGGKWTNGASSGVDWNNVSTTPGLAIGHQPGNVQYTDGTALLTGSWGASQSAQGTVYIGPTYESDYPEVEIRLRSSLTAHSCTGYEIAFKAINSNQSYIIIVKWNGKVGNFTMLAKLVGPQYGLRNGDVVAATIIGNVITAYINGEQKAQVTDNTYSSGNPGIGFNFDCHGACKGKNNGYGFKSFSVMDGYNTQPPPP